MLSLDFETPVARQKALMALYGLFIILPTAFLGCIISWLIFLDGLMALAGGFSIVMVVGGCLGYFTVVVQQAVQQVNIRVVSEE